MARRQRDGRRHVHERRHLDTGGLDLVGGDGDIDLVGGDEQLAKDLAADLIVPVLLGEAERALNRPSGG